MLACCTKSDKKAIFNETIEIVLKTVWESNFFTRQAIQNARSNSDCIHTAYLKYVWIDLDNSMFTQKYYISKSIILINQKFPFTNSTFLLKPIFWTVVLQIHFIWMVRLHCAPKCQKSKLLRNHWDFTFTRHVCKYPISTTNSTSLQKFIFWPFLFHIHKWLD